MILACVAGAVSAVGAITTAEKFPGERHISGLALGATSATAIFGGLTPYVAQVLTERAGWTMVPGAMIAAVAVWIFTRDQAHFSREPRGPTFSIWSYLPCNPTRFVASPPAGSGRARAITPLALGGKPEPLQVFALEEP